MGPNWDKNGKKDYFHTSHLTHATQLCLKSKFLTAIVSQLTSQEHCTNQVAITLMTKLLPDLVTFIFRSREIVTASGNRIYLFSSPQESFHFCILLLIC